MIRRLLAWWVTWGCLGVLLGVLIYLAIAGRHSTPRSEPQPAAASAAHASGPRPDGTAAAKSGAPSVSVPVGAPSPGLALGIGRRVQHRAERASGDSLARPAPSPSPRPTGVPSPVRAGTAGGSAHGTASAAASYRPLPSDCRLPCYGVARVGPASWYDAGPGFYAAIPGYVDGTVVAVAVCTFPDGQANCHTFPVVTSCGCYRHTASEHIVDLSPAAFQLFEKHLHRGIVQVQITVLR